MKRHLNRKKIDPRHAKFWKKMVASPFVVFLERKMGHVPGRYFYNNDTSTGAALKCMAQGHGNACILQRQEVGADYASHFPVIRSGDMITAFYFPFIPGLRMVRLAAGGGLIAIWTPEGSEFRQPPLPLPAILDECRSLPTALTEIPWERILEGSRNQADYPIIHHDFGRTIEINGKKYRRAILVHPYIPSLAFLGDTYLQFQFDHDMEQDFEFYQETWMLETEFQTYIAQQSQEFSIESDTFIDQPTKGVTRNGVFEWKYDHRSKISDLGRLLQDETQKRHAMTNFTALGSSSSKSILQR